MSVFFRFLELWKEQSDIEDIAEEVEDIVENEDLSKYIL